MTNNRYNIGESAFNSTAITDIEIPASVTSFGNEAFRACSNLSKAVIFTRTAAFGGNVFYDTDINSDGIYGFEGSTAQNYASDNSIPFHPIYSVSFDTDGGTSMDDTLVLTEELTEPADPVKSGFVFRGWFLDTEFSEPAVFPLSVTEDITLFAKWTELALTLSPTDGQIYTGGRVTITPNVEGGTWDFDTELLSQEDNTFTGLKAGSVRVTYTVGSESVYADIVIIDLELTLSPADGQIYTGGRVTITPNVEGGTWDFDTELLSRDGNTFTGLKAGTARVTYTIDGVSAYADIVITAAVLPTTGQDGTVILELIGLSAFIFAAALYIIYTNRQRQAGLIEKGF